MAGLDEIAVGAGGAAGPSEQPPVEEERFDLPVAELLADKKQWKARRQGWEQLSRDFRSSAADSGAACFAEFGPRVADGVQDAQAAVQEAALECAALYLAAVGDKVQRLDGILQGVFEKGMQGRPKAAQLAYEAAAVAVEQGCAAAVLEAAQGQLLKARAPKQKQVHSGAIERLATEFGSTAFEVKPLLGFAGRCLAEKDDKTKKSGRAICLLLYQQKFGDALYSVLEGLKDAALKPADIEEVRKVVAAAEGKPPPAPTRLVKGVEAVSPTAAGPAAGSGGGDVAMAYDFADETQVIKHLPKDFYERWIDPKLKFPDREKMYNDHLLPHVQKIRLAPSENYRDLMAAFKRTLGDSNAGVVAMTLRAIVHIAKGLRQHFAPYGKGLFPTVIDLLKVKTKAVSDATQEALDVFFEHGIINPSEHCDTCLAAADNKVPLTRVLTLNWIARCVGPECPPEKAQRAMKAFGPCIMKNVEHSDAASRNAAVDAAVAYARNLGTDSCRFLEGASAAVQEKVAKQLAAGGGDPGASQRRPLHSSPRRQQAAAPAAHEQKGAARAAPPSRSAGQRTKNAQPAAADRGTPMQVDEAPQPSVGNMRDLRTALTPELMAALQSDDWKKKDGALGDIAAFCRGSRVKPDVGPELIGILKARLQDKNKNIVPQACTTVTELVRAMGQAARIHGPELIPTLMQLLGDQKAPVKAGARKGLDEFDTQCGLPTMLPHFPKAMATDVPLARQALLELLSGMLDRQGRLQHGALQDIVRPLVVLLQDRRPENRHLAEDVLRHVISNVGYEAVQRHVGSLQPSNQRALQPILDKNRQGAVGKHADPCPDRPRSTTPPPQSGGGPRTQKRDEHEATLGHAGLVDEGLRTPGCPTRPSQARVPARITSMDQAVSVIGDESCMDGGAVEDAVRFILSALERNPSSIPIDETVVRSMSRLSAVHLTMDPDEELNTEVTRPLLNMLTVFFQNKIAEQVSIDALYELIGGLLDNLLSETLHRNAHDDSARVEEEESLRQLNQLMLKILERAGRVNCFAALMRRLDSYTKADPHQVHPSSGQGPERYLALVVKCLMKLTRFICIVRPDELKFDDFVICLQNVQEFLQANPPSIFKDRELPLRTIKTILNEFVKVKGAGVKEYLKCVTGDTSLIGGFVDMCIQNEAEERARRGDSPVPVLEGQPSLRSDAETQRLHQELDRIFVRIRKSETAKEAILELHHLRQQHPEFDIEPWLLRCSKPFQGYVMRQLEAMEESGAAPPPPSAPAGGGPENYAQRGPAPVGAYEDESLQSIRDRMQSLRGPYGR